MTATSPSLEQSAAIFNAIRSPRPPVDVIYDHMSAGLLWLDEVPYQTLPPRQWWCIRPVISCRTAIAMGTTSEADRVLWAYARSLFPEWVGFREPRCRWDEVLMNAYRTRQGLSPSPIF